MMGREPREHKRYKRDADPKSEPPTPPRTPHLTRIRFAVPLGFEEPAANRGFMRRVADGA